MNPDTTWYEWLPEVLQGLRMTVSRSHGMTPFFLTYKQDPLQPGRPTDGDPRYLLVQDSELAKEGALAERLCGVFAAVRAQVSANLTNADKRSKKYYDTTTLKITDIFPPGDQVVRKQRRQGKLFPTTEGPFDFVRYTRDLTSVVVTDGTREFNAHVFLLSRA